MTWSESPWLGRSSAVGRTIVLVDRIYELARSSTDPARTLSAVLGEFAAEFSTTWTAVYQRDPTWKIAGEFGRYDAVDVPFQLMDSVLDRGAAAFTDPDGAGRRTMAVPLAEWPRPAVLLAVGRDLLSQTLPQVMFAARMLSIFLSEAHRRAENAKRVEQLRHTLEVATAFAAQRETQPLLERIADEATRLLDCERASIFLWDREHKQVVAVPALGVEGGKLWLPDHRGIVGDVIHKGQTIRVDDAYADERFDRSVDKSSGFKTRNLLCTPLTSSTGKRIGAFELINKRSGSFTSEDEAALQELAIQVAVAIQYTREREQLIRSHRQLTEQVTSAVEIIGNSTAVQGLRATIQRLAVTDLPVLILGESGTGKEVAAQSLHYQGPRRDHPFIAVNCAALTETLLESELFGHEKGAFTDAHETRMGKFELADGGTLFLDEIGDMSPGGQAKLLRVLEQRVVTRVGGSQNIPIDVRVVAATNAKLTEHVRAKKFREDLYYRLSVVSIELPPLRDRSEDILPLADHFLDRFCRQAKRTKLRISPEAARQLQAHHWPGNIRELRNVMERLAFLAQGETIEMEDIAFLLSRELSPYDGVREGMSLSDATDNFQREYIRRMMKRMNQKMKETSRVLGMHRSNLYRKMRQLGMEEEIRQMAEE